MSALRPFDRETRPQCPQHRPLNSRNRRYRNDRQGVRRAGRDRIAQNGGARLRRDLAAPVGVQRLDPRHHRPWKRLRQGGQQGVEAVIGRRQSIIRAGEVERNEHHRPRPAKRGELLPLMRQGPCKFGRDVQVRPRRTDKAAGCDGGNGYSACSQVCATTTGQAGWRARIARAASNDRILRGIARPQDQQQQLRLPLAGRDIFGGIVTGLTQPARIEEPHHRRFRRKIEDPRRPGHRAGIPRRLRLRVAPVRRCTIDDLPD